MGWHAEKKETVLVGQETLSDVDGVAVVSDGGHRRPGDVDFETAVAGVKNLAGNLKRRADNEETVAGDRQVQFTRCGL